MNLVSAAFACLRHFCFQTGAGARPFASGPGGPAAGFNSLAGEVPSSGPPALWEQGERTPDPKCGVPRGWGPPGGLPRSFPVLQGNFHLHVCENKSNERKKTLCNDVWSCEVERSELWEESSYNLQTNLLPTAWQSVKDIFFFLFQGLLQVDWCLTKSDSGLCCQFSLPTHCGGCAAILTKKDCLLRSKVTKNILKNWSCVRKKPSLMYFSPQREKWAPFSLVRRKQLWTWTQKSGHEPEFCLYWLGPWISYECQLPDQQNGEMMPISQDFYERK